MLADNVSHVFSHQLARDIGVTSAQVRRDMMAVEFTGSPTRGYDVAQLNDALTKVLDAPTPEGVALVGVGNLGRAILTYFAGRHRRLSVTAAFDTDPDKIGRVIQGCRCHGMNEMPSLLRKLGIRTAIVAVPADQAQTVTDALIAVGVKGILNFAPARLRVPASVFVEHMDVAMSLEKVGFYARQQG